MKEVRSNKIQSTQEIVDKFTRNLNKIYREEGKAEIIGRKKIRSIVYVLSRLIKNNVLIIGHSGVGKTAVVKALVQQIEKRKFLNIYQAKLFSNLIFFPLWLELSFKAI